MERNVYNEMRKLFGGVIECIDLLSSSLTKMYNSSDIPENDKDKMAVYIVSRYFHQTFVDPLDSIDINVLPEEMQDMTAAFTSKLIQMIDKFTNDEYKRQNINMFCKEVVESASIYDNKITIRCLKDLFGDELYNKLANMTEGQIWTHQKDFKTTILTMIKNMISKKDENDNVLSYEILINDFLSDIDLVVGKRTIVDKKWSSEIGRSIDTLPTKQAKIDFIDKTIEEIKSGKGIKTLNDMYELKVFLSEIESVLKTFKGKDVLGDVLTVQLMSAIKEAKFPEDILTNILMTLDPARNGEPYEVDDLMKKIRKSIEQYLPSEKDLIMDGMKTGKIKILIEEADD